MKAKLMAKQELKLSRRWTIEETDPFAEILADPDNGFAQILECLVLQKSQNNEKSSKIWRVIALDISTTWTFWIHMVILLIINI